MSAIARRGRRGRAANAARAHAVFALAAACFRGAQQKAANRRARTLAWKLLGLWLEAIMQTNQTVSGSMSLPVVTVGPDAQVQEVLSLAEEKGVHHFPIVTDGKLVGIVCTCDLQELGSDAKVMEAAWRFVVTLPHDSPLRDAARLMALHGVGSIVVLEEGRVGGIVTRQDCIRAAPELEQLLWDARCVACGTRFHLRPGPDGHCICQDCQVRARESGWLDVGGG
jgi:CBS domain-containing protein